eukprot:gene6781-10945_t
MIFQTLVAVVALLIVAIILLENSYKIKNRTTGNSIPVAQGFLSSIISLFSKSKVHHGFFSSNLHKENGDMIVYYPLLKPVVSVASPELARIVLTNSKTFPKPNQKINVNTQFEKIINPKNVFLLNGEDWKRHRQSINSGFYDLSIYTEKIVDKTDISMECIKKEPIIPDIHEILQKMTLDVLGVTIFDHEFDSLRGSLGKDLVSYNKVMSILLNPKNMIFLMATKNFQEFVSFQKELSENSKNLLILLSKLINESKERLEKGGKSNSMLDFMIDAHLNEELSEVELISNVFIFFIAGHETTAKSLAFAMILLAQHPEVQEKARKEVLEVLGDKKCDYESCSKLKYLSMIIKESMRLYSPVVSANRITTKEVILGGYTLPKDQLVQVSITAIHHSPEVYENPDEFIPERWEKKIPNFAWIPFSASSRVCVGNNFSLLEQNIFLATLLQKFKFEATDKNAKITIDPTNRVMGPNPLELQFKEISITQ